MRKFFRAFCLAVRKLAFYRRWRCNICGREVFAEENYCKECEKELPKCDYSKICDHCGRATPQSTPYCTNCKNRLVYTDRARSVYAYEGKIPRLIKKMKYRGSKYLAEILSKDMADRFNETGLNADYLCSVPLYKDRQKKRGFNQSELLAKYLSSHINIPYADVTEKVKATPNQASLSAESRIKNLASCFKVKDKSAVKGKSFIVVDDVTTTGSTGEAIAKVLKKNGATAVYLYTVANVTFKDNV